MKYFNHFSCREFFPNCSDTEIATCFRDGLADNLLTLIEFLDEFRTFIALPIRITSSFRDYNHNVRVGGAKLSQHLCGSAIDFCCLSLPIEALALRLKDFLEETAFKDLLGQVIIYKSRNFIHVALRSPMHKQLVISYE